MKFCFGSVLFGIVTILLCSCGDGEQEKLNSAVHLYKEKKFTKAFIELQKIEESQQKRLLEGKIQIELGNFDEAVLNLKRVEVEGPLADTVHYLIAKAYDEMRWEAERQGQDAVYFTEEMLTYSGSAIKENPEYYEAYKLQSKALHNLEQYQENLAFLEKTTQIFPDSSLFLLYGAFSKVGLQDFKSAESDITKFIDICSKTDSSNLALAFRFRGSALEGMKEFDSAINAYSESLRYKKLEYTLMDRADCYLILGERMKACDDYRSAANAGYLEAYGVIKSLCNAYGY